MAIVNEQIDGYLKTTYDAAAQTSNVVEVRDFIFGFRLNGATGAQLQLEIGIGGEWVPYGAALSADAPLQVVQYPRLTRVRGNLTALTTGSPILYLSGRSGMDA